MISRNQAGVEQAPYRGFLSVLADKTPQGWPVGQDLVEENKLVKEGRRRVVRLGERRQIEAQAPLSHQQVCQLIKKVLWTLVNPAIHLLLCWNIILLPCRYKAPWQEQARTDIPTQAGNRLVDITARPTRSIRREESRRPITRISFFCRRSKMLNHLGLSWLLSPIDGLNFKVMYKQD